MEKPHTNSCITPAHPAVTFLDAGCRVCRSFTTVSSNILPLLYRSPYTPFFVEWYRRRWTHSGSYSERNGLTGRNTEEWTRGKKLIADRVKISVRYLTAIENEGRKPSYKVLFRLIRSIGISADLIFYPEERNSDTDGAQLVRLIHQCDVRDRKVVLAVVEALLADKKDWGYLSVQTLLHSSSRFCGYSWVSIAQYCHLIGVMPRWFNMNPAIIRNDRSHSKYYEIQKGGQPAHSKTLYCDRNMQSFRAITQQWKA